MAKKTANLAKVVRDGALQRLETERLVPGDIIHLEAGDLVPADARILEAASLQADESAMTGESVPVSKGLLSALPEDTPLAERHNMVLASTVITRGRAVCVVTGTGMDTELGKIAALMNQTQQRKTPLQQSLDSFSAKLAMVIMAICAVVFALSIFRTGMGILDSLMFAVALAVAAIPEALSSIVTIVLAMGTQKMARQNAIIKDLKAVETLGSVSIICSDKTGTLTEDLAVLEYYTDILGNESARTLGLAYLECTRQGMKRNQLDRAVATACSSEHLSFPAKDLSKAFSLCASDPFDHVTKASGVKLAATPGAFGCLGFSAAADARLTIVKGEVESVCARCSWADFKG